MSLSFFYGKYGIIELLFKGGMNYEDKCKRDVI